MAKIKGGLLSEHAHGSIGNMITYQGRRHFDHVHKKPKPRNPRSAAQTTNRDNFAEVIATWHLLTDVEKAAYTPLGAKLNNIPGFNAFIKINIGKVGYWTRYAENKFGNTKKFGGPLGSQTT